MRCVERKFEGDSRKQEFKLYVIGDVHIGTPHCAEAELRGFVKMIAKNPDAYWIGGGDYCDAVILGDVKRFDVNTLPDWMLTGPPGTIKERIGDILYAQRDRFLEIIDPIRDKCLGMVEGNHEYSIFKYHNRDHMNQLCQEMKVDNLTDCAFMRLKFMRTNKGTAAAKATRSRSLTVFICHGLGGGRALGSEANKLEKMAGHKDADIILTGHTHSFCIAPPIVAEGLPASGKVPESPVQRVKRAANWGSWVHNYKAGPSSYASRALYPSRAMLTVETVIRPHKVIATSSGISEECEVLMHEYGV